MAVAVLRILVVTDDALNAAETKRFSLSEFVGRLADERFGWAQHLPLREWVVVAVDHC